MNKLILVFALLGQLNLCAYTSPSLIQETTDTKEVIKYSLKSKGCGLDQNELFKKAVANEKLGFFGYHGNSIDFLIYQEILKKTIEEIVETPIRADFHFVANPLNKRFESLEDIAPYFTLRYHPQQIFEETFPLNLSIYSNHNRIGWNSLVNFTKNESDKSLKYYQDDLRRLFGQLGVDKSLVFSLYELSAKYFDGTTGCLLQLFDNSADPYQFVNKLAYPSRPDGFILENCQISTYFDEAKTNYPGETRFLLTSKGILNPHCPVIFVRYTKTQTSKLKLWEAELKKAIQDAAIDPHKKSEIKTLLLHLWNKA